MTRNNITNPEKSGQQNQPRVADDRSAQIKESMESVQKYEKIAEDANQLTNRARRVKVWEMEQGRRS